MTNLADSPQPPSDIQAQPRPILIRDQQPANPLVTYSLLAVTVLIYIFQFATETFLGTDIPALLGMKINELIVAGQWWRFITPMFLHGSILHIGFNMYALLSIGSSLEREFGHFRFALLYVLSAFAGNVLSFVLSPNPSLGASTAIFGLLAAQGIFLFINRSVFGSRARAALQSVLMIAGINLFIGLSPGIDNWGHMGGLLGGLIFSWFAAPRFSLEQQDQQFIHIKDLTTPLQVSLGVVFVTAIFSLLAWLGK